MQLLGNFELGFVRRFIIIFNCILIIQHFIYDPRDTYLESSNFVINCLLSAFIVFATWNSLSKLLISRALSKCDQQLIILLLANNLNFFSKNEETNHGKFKKLFFDIIEEISSKIRLKYIFNSSDEKINLLYGNNKMEEALPYERIFTIFKLEHQHDKKYADRDYMNDFIMFLHAYITGNDYYIHKYYVLIMLNNKINIPSVVRNTVSFVFNQSSEEKFGLENYFVVNSIRFAIFYSGTKQILKRFLAIIEEKIELKTCDKVFLLSKDIFDNRKELVKYLTEIEAKTQQLSLKVPSKKSTYYKEYQNSRNIQLIYRYSTMICRYIIETLTNEELSEFPQLLIEAYEEFLQAHYQNDNFLVLSSTFSEEEDSQFKIVKSTGINKKGEKFLTDLFPREIKTEGNQKLMKTLLHQAPSSIKGSGADYSFDFIVKLHEFYEHFHLEFEMAHSLIENNFMIYGFYTRIQKKTILFKLERGENIVIQGFSKYMSKILGISPEALEFIERKNNKKLIFNEIFQDIQIFTDNTYDDKVGGTLFDQVWKITCEIDYSLLYSNVMKIFGREAEKYSINKVNTYDKKPEKELDKEAMNSKAMLIEIKKDLSCLKGTKSKLIFKKLFPVNEHYCFFKCSDEKSTAKKASLLIIQSKETGKDYKTAIRHEDEVSKNSEEIQKKLNLLLSTVSMTEQNGSVGSSVQTNSSKKKKENAFNIPEVRSELRKISLTSYIGLGISILLIIFCFIFLFVQIVETKSINNIISISYQYKRLRHALVNTFFTTTSMICLETDFDKEECSSKFLFLTNKFQDKIGFSDYRIIDFFWYELIYKINSLKNFYTSFKQTIGKQFIDFKFLLESEITYNYIVRYPVLEHERETISFSVGIERMINAELQLVNGDTGYFYIPYYVFNFTDGKYDLIGSVVNDFNEYQTQIFNIVSNYARYYKTFNKGTNTITKHFNQSRANNLSIVLSFMITFIGVNLIALYTNIQYILYSNLLFTQITEYAFIKISQKDFKKLLSQKISHLIELSELYLKNPNNIIHKLSDNQNELIEYRRIKAKRNSVISPRKEKHKEEKEEIPKIYLTPHSFQMKDFTKTSIKPILIKNILIYVIYTVVIGIFDITIIILLSSVYTFKEYVDINYDMETYAYTDISILNLYHLVNISQELFSEVILEDTPEDGLINQLLRESFSLYDQMMYKIKQDNYPTQEDFIPFECDEMYTKANDTIIKDYHVYKGIDNIDEMYKLQKLVCSYLSFPKLKYELYGTYFSIVHNLNNKYNDRDEKGIFSLFLDDYFFEAYAYLYFYFRPIKRNFDVNYLTPIINDKIKIYSMVLWIYLVLNIILECLIFLIHKFYISEKLKEIKKYFLLFLQCIH